MTSSTRSTGPAVALALTVAWSALASADVREVVKRVEACTLVVRTESAVGSGFLVSPDGLLVTNHHVVAGARSAAVRLRNGDVYEQVWRVVEDAQKDFAVLRVAGFGRDRALRPAAARSNGLLRAGPRLAEQVASKLGAQLDPF